MKRYAAAITVAVAALVAIVLLLTSAGGDQRYTSFSLDVVPSEPAASLASGQLACQGPINAVAPIDYVIPWITPVVLPGPPILLTVRDYATHGVLAYGRLPTGYTYSDTIAPTIHLNTTVPQGREISVCVRNLGPKPIDLVGNDPNLDSGTLVAQGKAQPLAAMFLFQRHPVSLLSQIPAVFRRASVFRLGIVGSWTFWVLAILLLGSFGLVGFAVTHAERSDTRSSEQTDPQ